MQLIKEREFSCFILAISYTNMQKDKIEPRYHQEQGTAVILSENQPSPHVQLLKVMADNDLPRLMWALRISTILVVIVILALAAALPSPFEKLTNELVYKVSQPPPNDKCNPTLYDSNDRLFCARFSSANPRSGLVMKNVGPLNQYMVLYVEVSFNSTGWPSIDQDIEVQESEIEFVTNQNNRSNYDLVMRRPVYNLTGRVKVSAEQQTALLGFVLAYDKGSPRLRQKGSNFAVISKFTNFTQLESAVSVETKALVVTSRFTYFTIILRAFYCLLSIITTVVFLKRFCQLQQDDRVLEIRLVAITSCFLIFFNDPFYSLTVLLPNGFSTFLSSLFSVSLLTLLHLVWMFFLRRIYYEPEDRHTQLLSCRRSWPFYLLVLFIFASSCGVFFLYAFYAFNNIPILGASSLSDMKAVPAVAVASIAISISVLYQIIMCIRIGKKYWWDNRNVESPEEKNILPQRHKNYLVFYPFFLVMFIIFFAFGGAMPYSYEAAWILYGYSFMNLFVYILQILYYTPATELSRDRSSGGQSAEMGSVSLDQANQEQAHKKMEEASEGIQDKTVDLS